MHLLERTNEEFETESNLQRTRYDLGVRRLDSCEKQISQMTTRERTISHAVS